MNQPETGASPSAQTDRCVLMREVVVSEQFERNHWAIHQDPTGECARCLEVWIEEMQAKVKTAEEDVVGDMGQEAWESGASDVIRSVVEMSGAPAKAISEVLRMEGVLPREGEFRQGIPEGGNSNEWYSA